MIRKSPVLCENCHRSLGFKLSRKQMEPIYCYACEGFIIHREEMRERDHEIYHRTLSQR